LCYGSEKWIINERETPKKLETAKIRFLKPLLEFTRLDSQRNPDICKRLKVDNIVLGIKLYQKKWLYDLERMDRSRLPELAFQYQLGNGGIWEDQDEDGETKNTLNFKGEGLKT
jgi:hypothetical protein